jgi:GH15 family glucan-1,4-alpha-glucosidase
LLGHLAKLCIQNISKPDAGLWELRNGWQEHSFSNLMCWAGIDRIQKIQERGHLKNIDSKIAEAKKIAENALRSAIKEGSLRNGPKDDSSDAALLQIANLRFPDFELCRNTVQKIHQELKTGADGAAASFLYRYLRNDDFGQPKSAFLICSFWLVQALVKIGQTEDARKVMKDAMNAGNTLGLFSEHFIPDKQQQAGNFPQAYSHVGQINAAFSISPPWDEIL